jgi:hypothetical protein
MVMEEMEWNDSLGNKQGLKEYESWLKTQNTLFIKGQGKGSVLGFEQRASSLLGRQSTSSSFCSGYILEIRFCILLRQGEKFYAFHHSWDDRYMFPCPAFSIEMGVSQTFSHADLEL